MEKMRFSSIIRFSEKRKITMKLRLALIFCFFED